MALLQHSIGSFNFVRLQPVPPNLKRQVITETRSGVDGHAIWFDGTRGPNYMPRTIANFATHADARAAKSQYEASIGERLPIVYAGDSTYRPAVVIDVECEIRDQAAGVGGLNVAPTTRALLYADWTLLIV